MVVMLVMHTRGMALAIRTVPDGFVKNVTPFATDFFASVTTTESTCPRRPSSGSLFFHGTFLER